ncbi:hypothetical protein UAM5_00013 [Ralstonia phage UAM5]|nr:hypothetical protein UAM5_00013 [Ralstonia phage UAM5]
MRTAQGERRNSTMQANNNLFTGPMVTALARAPRDWHQVPSDVRLRTVMSLAARGLVEIKRVMWLGKHTDMWRAMRKA